MSNYAHWDEAEWSQLTLGSTTLPGSWEVEGEAKRNVDIKTQKDRDGAVVKDKGYENADVTLVGSISKKADWDALAKALKEIHPRRKGAARDPLAVVHPALSVLGITNLYVIAIGTPKLGDDGIVRISIKCLEWVPAPKPVPAKKQKPITKEQQHAANRAVTFGRELTDANGNTRVDLGVPPPRDSALAFLEPNRIAP